MLYMIQQIRSMKIKQTKYIEININESMHRLCLTQCLSDY